MFTRNSIPISKRQKSKRPKPNVQKLETKKVSEKEEMGKNPKAVFDPIKFRLIRASR